MQASEQIPFSAEMATASVEKNQLSRLLKNIENTASLGNTQCPFYDKLLVSSKESLEALGYKIEAKSERHHIITW